MKTPEQPLRAIRVEGVIKRADSSLMNATVSSRLSQAIVP